MVLLSRHAQTRVIMMKVMIDDHAGNDPDWMITVIVVDDGADDNDG